MAVTIIPQLPGSVKRPPKRASALVIGTSPDTCVENLLELGYSVRFPARNLREALVMLCESDFLALPAGSDFDRDVNVVISVARALGLPVLDCSTLEPKWLP